MKHVVALVLEEHAAVAFHGQFPVQYLGHGRAHNAPRLVGLELHFIDENESVKSWEYAVLVSNAAYGLEQIGQLYRDRAASENGFDEIKNQWDWGGYSTQEIERCALSSRAKIT